jgi:hypothetical protein
MMLNWLRCYQNSMAKINHFGKTEREEREGRWTGAQTRENSLPK